MKKMSMMFPMFPYYTPSDDEKCTVYLEVILYYFFTKLSLPFHLNIKNFCLLEKNNIFHLGKTLYPKIKTIYHRTKSSFFQREQWRSPPPCFLKSTKWTFFKLYMEIVQAIVITKLNKLCDINISVYTLTVCKTVCKFS